MLNSSMLRVIIPIVVAIAIIIGCIIYLNYDSSINSGETDVLYEDIVYERVDIGGNLRLYEDNSKYAGGDYKEILEYGQERLWEIRVLNDDENVLYSVKYVWLKPGYELPGDFGEEFSSAHYVVYEGIDARVLPDAYVELVNEHLADFEGSVKLEDIVASEASDITEFTEHGTICFTYKNHADMALYYYICEADGKYYLNVMQGSEWTDALYEIKPEYLPLLTSKLSKN